MAIISDKITQAEQKIHLLTEVSVGSGTIFNPSVSSSGLYKEPQPQIKPEGSLTLARNPINKKT